MQYRPLGSTGLSISAISFGAGPVSGLMTGDEADRRTAVLARAIDVGVNWIDTAATYGQGRSEEGLGESLSRIGPLRELHIATKVRFLPEHLGAIREHARQSFANSLSRLRVERVTLLQLHNSITRVRGAQATSVTPQDVLGPGGILDAFEELRQSGQVAHLGLTGIGEPEALREVIESGRVETIQIPYHVLNPSAGQPMPPGFDETDYGNVIADCAKQNMGVMAIRVYAAGALLDQPPSAHTLTTPFFPLDLYKRDIVRARKLSHALGQHPSMSDVAVRFVLSHPHIASAIIGFGEPSHVDAAVSAMEEGPLPSAILDQIHALT